MARGNQRDKAREANQKKMADQVSIFFCANVSDSSGIYADSISRLQKKSNNMSGSEMQREKEKVAAKMREKQAAGRSSGRYFFAERI
jgi:4F5 protein related disordered region